MSLTGNARWPPVPTYFHQTTWYLFAGESTNENYSSYRNFKIVDSAPIDHRRTGEHRESFRAIYRSPPHRFGQGKGEGRGNWSDKVPNRPEFAISVISRKFPHGPILFPVKRQRIPCSERVGNFPSTARKLLRYWAHLPGLGCPHLPQFPVFSQLAGNFGGSLARRSAGCSSPAFSCQMALAHFPLLSPVGRANRLYSYIVENFS